MHSLKADMAAFRSARQQRVAEARQNAAFFIMTGVDLQEALRSAGEACTAVQRRVSRLLERERLKGLRGHWSYDLNRHIALKNAFARLCMESSRTEAGDAAILKRRRSSLDAVTIRRQRRRRPPAAGDGRPPA